MLIWLSNDCRLLFALDDIQKLMKLLTEKLKCWRKNGSKLCPQRNWFFYPNFVRKKFQKKLGIKGIHSGIVNTEMGKMSGEV